MAKKIKITEADLEVLRQDFEEAAQKGKMADGKFSFTKDFGTVDRKITVYFSEKAWLKMRALVENCSKEIAWRGVAFRTEGGFIVKDVLCFPQKVTGSTVDVDVEDDALWYINLEDDVRDNLRFQGHSHVNFGVTPSGTDQDYYDRLLQTVPDDGFYIFMIMNKKWDKTIKVYDLAENILYETKDVTIEVTDNDYGLTQFVRDALEMLKDPIPTTSKTTAVQCWTDNKTDSIVTTKKKAKRKSSVSEYLYGYDDEEAYGYGYGYGNWH